jgi:hypothetical protein
MGVQFCGECGKKGFTRRYAFTWTCSTCKQKRANAKNRALDAGIANWVSIAKPDLTNTRMGAKYIRSGCVRFCSEHGIVHENGWADLNKCSCPCAQTSAPSKTIKTATIHFGIRSSKGWTLGCVFAKTPADDGLVPTSSNLEYITCRSCMNRIKKVMN